ncbi:MAG: hypothetical protein WB780_02320 [Candidatus Acidiferrales bacterium]
MSSAPAPKPKSSNAIWWVLGVMAGAIVLLVAGSLIFAGLFIRHVSVNESGNKVVVDTPVGSIRVNNDETHPTGLPIYPGATSLKTEGTSIELSSQSGAAMGVATENYTTSDDLDKVSAWYQQKLGPKYRRESDAGGTLHARGQHGAKADIVFTNDSGEGSRIVTLTKKFSGVEITLLRFGKREIQ